MTSYNDNREISHRNGENAAPVISRNNRFFKQASGWFFSTREGIDQGPFESRIMAHVAIQNYIRKKTSMIQ